MRVASLFPFLSEHMPFCHHESQIQSFFQIQAPFSVGLHCFDPCHIVPQSEKIGVVRPPKSTKIGFFAALLWLIPQCFVHSMVVYYQLVVIKYYSAILYNVRQQIHKKPWSNLTPRQKATRKKALDIVSQAKRTNQNITTLAKQNKISFRTVQNHTNAFKKIDNKWVPKKFDFVSRSLLISEKGKTVSVEVSDSRHAKTIGQYRL